MRGQTVPARGKKSRLNPNSKNWRSPLEKSSEQGKKRKTFGCHKEERKERREKNSGEENKRRGALPKPRWNGFL